MKLTLRRPSLLGPLGMWELRRLARSGQVVRARLLVLYLLLITFVLIPILWFPTVDPVELFTGSEQRLSAEELPAFANRFALVVFAVILVAVIAITPAYAAAGLAEEKERRTLSLLLATPLTEREIVVGKAAPRLTFILAAAAGGFPVLALVRMYGGADIDVVLAGCGIIVSTAIMATAIGIHAACVNTRLRDALIQAYATTAVPFLLWVSLSSLRNHDAPEVQLVALLGYAVCAIGQVVVAGALFGHAVRQLRREANIDGSDRPRFAEPIGDADAVGDRFDAPAEIARKSIDPNPLEESSEEWGPFDEPLVLWTPPVWEPPPIDDDNPIGWRERHLTGRRTAETGFGAGWLIGGIALLLTVVGVGMLIARLWPEKYYVNVDGTRVEVPARPFGGPLPENDPAGYLLIIAGTIFSGVYLTVAAIGLAAAIARERHKRTLDDILMIPISRREILRAKVRVIVRRGLGWGLLAVPATGLAFVADGGWRLGVAAAGFVAANAALVIGAGALLTVRCPTEIRAFRLLIPITVLAIGAPVGLWNAISWFRPHWLIAEMFVWVLVAGIASGLLWRRACREMEFPE